MVNKAKSNHLAKEMIPSMVSLEKDKAKSNHSAKQANPPMVGLAKDTDMAKKNCLADKIIPSVVDT